MPVKKLSKLRNEKLSTLTFRSLDSETDVDVALQLADLRSVNNTKAGRETVFIHLSFNSWVPVQPPLRLRPDRVSEHITKLRVRLQASHDAPEY